MESALIQRLGVMTVFGAEFQPGDASPHDALLAVSGPGHPLVGGTAFAAHQQFRQSILA